MNRVAWKLGGVGVLAHQFEDGWNETQAIVRFLDFLMMGDAGVGAAGKQQDGMGGGTQERAVIAARIEIANVEVPMIVGEDDEIGLSQASPALVEAGQ